MQEETLNKVEEANKATRDLTVDVIIPTYRSDDKLNRLLTMLDQQSKKANKVIILHTQEYEGQEQPLPKLNNLLVTTIPIEKKSFDHGGTRRYGASLSDADILMFMTQDAVPADELLIEKLLAPYEDITVAATYARQLADNKTDILERYTRYHNYPKSSRIKSIEDIDELGIKAFFCSNVCATYRNSVYQKLGGFVEKTIFNEDMIMAAGMLRANYKIAYVAESKVVHAHNYSYLQQFTRNFDLGVSHNEYEEVFHGIKSESEGIKLVKRTLQYLIDQKKYYLIPDLILNSGFKYLGYLMGRHYDLLPKSLVIRCSMNKSYWT